MRVVIGFPKCGQVSVVQYLRKKYPNETIKKDELIWIKDGVEKFRSKWENAKVVIVERDPVDRMWLAYNFMQYGGDKKPPIRELYTFPEYLEITGYENLVGEMNPVSQSNYEKWIGRWLEFKPEILKLEELQTHADFSHENITKKITGEPFKPMPEAYRVLAWLYLDKEKLNHPSISWSID